MLKNFGTNLNLNIVYHLELDGQTERTNRIIEDMLRMYVMDQLSKWEDYIHLVEFSYNNGYKASLKISPFEGLYCKKCNTPVNWDNLVEKDIIGTDLLWEMEEKIDEKDQT